MDVPMHPEIFVGRRVLVRHGKHNRKLGKILSGGSVKAVVKLLEVNSDRHVIRRSWGDVKLFDKFKIDESSLSSVEIKSESWLTRILRRIFG